MRPLLLVLPALLSGCSLFAGHDGTYLVTLELKSDSCDEENPSIGQKQQSLASLYRTGDSLVFDLGGVLLVGPPAEGNAFELGHEEGSQVSYDGCDNSVDSSVIELEGTFTSDLGMEGVASSSQTRIREACPEDEEEVCTFKYSVTGLKLDATRDLRPTGSIAWGYFPGGGY